MVRVCELKNVYSYDAGCTCPALVLLDNGKQAIFKYPKNPEGIIVLFNEFVSTKIAERATLTVPASGVAIFDENTRVPEKYGDSLRFQGVGFYSEYIPRTTKISERAAKHLVNLDELCRLVLVDHIVKNTDRYDSNVLLEYSGENKRMISIDYSHAFGHPNWEQCDLKIGDAGDPCVWIENCSLYEMLIRAGACFFAEKLQDEAQQIKANLTESFLDNVLDSIPQEWCAEIGTEKIGHARDYVLSRINNIEIICETIIKERGLI